MIASPKASVSGCKLVIRTCIMSVRRRRRGQGKRTMGKGRSGSNAYKAVQQKIAGGMDIVTRIDGKPAPSKAELRASIPTYDPSMIKKIETGKKTLKPKA